MEFEFDANGNLVLTMDHPDHIEELRDVLDDYHKTESYIAECLHELFEFIAPETIGALTDAPILCPADETWIADNGDRKFAPGFNVYWFPQYEVINPWDELSDDGQVTFTKGN